MKSQNKRFSVKRYSTVKQISNKKIYYTMYEIMFINKFYYFFKLILIVFPLVTEYLVQILGKNQH